MAWIRKLPFDPDEDPKAAMIREVAEEAVRTGTPLSEVERQLLATEVTRGFRVPDETHARLQELVCNIVKRQFETGEAERNPCCLVAAVEWAGDIEYPYVVDLAERAVTVSRPPQTMRRGAMDLVGLILCGVAVVLLLMTIPLLLEVLWRS